MQPKKGKTCPPNVFKVSLTSSHHKWQTAALCISACELFVPSAATCLLSPGPDVVLFSYGLWGLCCSGNSGEPIKSPHLSNSETCQSLRLPEFPPSHNSYLFCQRSRNWSWKRNVYLMTITYIHNGYRSGCTAYELFIVQRLIIKSDEFSKLALKCYALLGLKRVGSVGRRQSIMFNYWSLSKQHAKKRENCFITSIAKWLTLYKMVQIPNN